MTYLDPFDRSERSIERIDEWKTVVVRIDRGIFYGGGKSTFLGKEMLSAAAVAAMAELEGLLRDVIVDISNRINDSQIRLRDIIPSLRPMAEYSLFDSIVNSSDHKKIWQNKRTITSLEFSDRIAKFPSRNSSGPQLPLSGRTIESSQLYTVWKVFSFPLVEELERCSESLKKLGLWRNDIAHRNVSVDESLNNPGRSPGELAGYLEDISSLLYAICISWHDYILHKRYIVKDVL